MANNRNYSEKLKDPRWQKKRLEIMQRDEFMCQTCGDNESTLHVHHKVYESKKEVWDYDNEAFITLCETCHYNLTEELNSCILAIRMNFTDSQELCELHTIIDLLISMPSSLNIMMARKFVELYKKSI